MRYLGFGIGHVDPAVRAQPEFSPGEFVSVLNALEDTGLDDEPDDTTNIDENEALETESDAGDNFDPEPEPDSNDSDDEPVPDFTVEPNASL